MREGRGGGQVVTAVLVQQTDQFTVFIRRKEGIKGLALYLRQKGE